MTDDGPSSARDNEALLYDYSKHLLSLALLGIGGIVTISQSPLGRQIKPGLIAMLIVLFAAAGLFALSCTSAILRARERDRAVPRAPWLYSRGAMLFLGVGVGAFLSFWLQALLK